MTYQVVLTFHLKEETEERFLEVKNILEKISLDYKGLLSLNLFKTDIETEKKFGLKPEGVKYKIAMEWENADDISQFINDGKAKRSVFEILEEIQISHSAAHWIKL